MEGYNIAIRDFKRTMWMEVGRVTANTQKFQIKDLQDGQEYLIRVFARNEIGMSEPLESDEPYLAITVKGKYSLIMGMTELIRTEYSYRTRRRSR